MFKVSFALFCDLYIVGRLFFDTTVLVLNAAVLYQIFRICISEAIPGRTSF